MRYLLTFCLSVAFFCSSLGQVTEAEYFIDTDPGYRNGIKVSITTGQEISKDFTADLTFVSDGFHTLGLRARDAQSRWSHTFLHPFYIFNSPATTIAAGEYFIDNDPGYGNATVITASVGSDSTVKFIAGLSSYSKGFHFIGLRFKDSRGGWSQTTLHTFYQDDNGTPVNIVSLQYYFTGNGATDSVYRYTIPTPSTSIDLNFTADLSQLPGDREYNMHVWAVNEKGVRSEVYIKKVKVCNGNPVKANFDFIALGNLVNFIDSSSGNRKYKWEFGDNKIDSVSNPTHTYLNGGNYTVKQIVSNFCNSDTVVKIIPVLTIRSIFPSKGGVSGSVTISVIGTGLNANTIFKLINNGVSISPTNVMITSPGLEAKVVFDFNTAPIGLYDLSVTNGNSSTVLPASFTVENNLPIKLAVRLIGRNRIRLSQMSKFTLEYENQSNIDLRGCVIMIGLPASATWNPESIILTEPQSPVKGDSSMCFYSENNGVNYRFYPFIVPYLPASGTGTFKFSVSVPELSEPEIIYCMYPPIYDDVSDQGRLLIADHRPAGELSTTQSVSNCFKDALQDALLEFTPLSCINNSGKNFQDFNKTFDKTACQRMKRGELEQVNTNINVDLCLDHHMIDFVAPLVPLVSTMVDCAKDVVKDKISKINRFFKIVFIGEKINNAGSHLYPCVDVFPNNLWNKMKVFVVTSVDPNEKVGTGGLTSENYFGGLELSYKICFENKNTATASAQEVIILDTLNKSAFDYSTLQLQSFGFGDTTIYVPKGLTEYATNTLLKRPGKPDLSVRTDAKLDTLTGILKWRFLSIDPLTRELISDPADGFLPPNITSPQGEGFISYSIQPKASLPHGAQVKNKASIYFDNNAPIITNEFLNTIDKQKPVSAVTNIPSEVFDTTFTVQWSGNDNGAGVRSYDVFYKINNGPYQLWQYDVSLGENIFTGKTDSVYGFFSIAKDYAGNREQTKSTAERTVTVRLANGSNKICPGSNTSFLISNAGAGSSYQWQADQGNGFTDIQNNTIYSGVNTTQLILSNPGTVYSNFKYRCKITNGLVETYSRLYTVKFENTWIGAVSNAWETAANWSCSIIPDANTDVVIPKVVTTTPVLNINGTCKSITLSKESNLLVKAGVSLNITGR